MTIQPQPAGSYNGNQGKDDYHQCISLSLSLFLPLRICHPLAHPLASTLVSSLVLRPLLLLPSPSQPLFKLNRSLALHFSAIEFDGVAFIGISGLDYHRVKLPIYRILRIICSEQLYAVGNYKRVIISFGEIISSKASLSC